MYQVASEQPSLSPSSRAVTTPNAPPTPPAKTQRTAPTGSEIMTWHLKKKARKPHNYASRNYNRKTSGLTDLLTGVKCRAANVAKNLIFLVALLTLVREEPLVGASTPLKRRTSTRQEMLFDCPQCPMKFGTETRLLRHLQNHC